MLDFTALPEGFSTDGLNNKILDLMEDAMWSFKGFEGYIDNDDPYGLHHLPKPDTTVANYKNVHCKADQKGERLGNRINISRLHLDFDFSESVVMPLLPDEYPPHMATKAFFALYDLLLANEEYEPEDVLTYELAKLIKHSDDPDITALSPCFATEKLTRLDRMSKDDLALMPTGRRYNHGSDKRNLETAIAKLFQESPSEVPTEGMFWAEKQKADVREAMMKNLPNLDDHDNVDESDNTTNEITPTSLGHWFDFDTDPIITPFLTGARFRITKHGMIKASLGKELQRSNGYLTMPHHFEVRRVISLAKLLKDSKTQESVGAYWVEDPDDLKNAPPMRFCLDELERGIMEMLDGEYDIMFSRSYGLVYGESDSSKPDYEAEQSFESTHNCWMELQNIVNYFVELREGRYYETDNPRYEGRRGIPRIETTGERIYNALLDFIWKIDCVGMATE